MITPISDFTQTQANKLWNSISYWTKLDILETLNIEESSIDFTPKKIYEILLELNKRKILIIIDKLYQIP